MSKKLLLVSFLAGSCIVVLAVLEGVSLHSLHQARLDAYNEHSRLSRDRIGRIQARTAVAAPSTVLTSKGCVEGVETFAAAAARIDGLRILPNNVVPTLREISEHAVQAEWALERARYTAPTLPKRMGAQSVVKPSPNESTTIPETRDCLVSLADGRSEIHLGCNPLHKIPVGRAEPGRERPIKAPERVVPTCGSHGFAEFYGATAPMSSTQ